MLKRHFSLAILALIFSIALFLRFWQLEANPYGLNRDEAAIGYNAFLILKKGVDEWNQSFPLIFTSFGDAKLPGYIYSTSLSFLVWGVNDFGVRFTSAFAGSLLCLAVYLLSRISRLTSKTSLIFSLLVAIAPFAVYYSRMGFEANLALLLFILYLTLVIHLSQQKRTQWWGSLVAGFLLLGAILTYNTPLILAPFIILLIPFLFSWEKWRSALPLFLITLLVTALGFYILLPLNQQKSGISIFSDEGTLFEYFTYRDQFGSIFSQKILGNQYVFYLQRILKNYLSSFNPKFMIENESGHPWHALPGFGQITWTIYLLGIIGLAWSFKNYVERTWRFIVAYKKINQRQYRFQFLKKWQLNRQTFFLLCFNLALIPSVITVDSPHATRSLLFLIFWLYFATIALTYLDHKLGQIIWQTILGKRISVSVVPLLLILVVMNVFPYYYTYFKYYQYQSGLIFGSNFKPLIQQVQKEFSNERIAIVDPDGYQYITLAWDLKIDPELYLATSRRQLANQIGLFYGEQIANFHFIARPEDQSVSSEKILIYQDRNDLLWKLSSE